MVLPSKIVLKKESTIKLVPREKKYETMTVTVDTAIKCILAEKSKMHPMIVFDTKSK